MKAMARTDTGEHNKLSAKDKAQERLLSKEQLQQQIIEVEKALADLKISYEQYFVGVLPLAPETEHADLRRRMRLLKTLPFKNSALQFQARNLESCYQTYNTYWQRVIKQREEGSYRKDLFKAKIRAAKVDSKSVPGAATKGAKGIETLYRRYKAALEEQLGLPVQLDFDAFRKKITDQARQLHKKSGGKKLAFAVAVKGGKVTIQAQIRD